MILHDLHIHGADSLKHIHVEHGKIGAVADSRNEFDHLSGELHLEMTNALAFPGLINSHDHLDFNLFPQIRNRIYNNYTEWGHDIQVNNKDAIKEVLKIPKHLRVQWGLYKNLLNGFTTVVNHGKKLMVKNDLITVFQDCYSLHSPAFEKNWKWKLNDPFKSRKPIVMHIGEGTDAAAKNEIDKVINGNFFKKEIVAVHGVAMDEEQATSFAGLVWCPASNYFLLNKTSAIDKLKHKTRVVFGTDSTLTASWNVWEHIRMARNSGMMNENELIASLTSSPAGLWGLSDYGSIAENKVADIMVARNKEKLFFDLNPEDILLVLHRGNIRLFDEALANQLKGFPVAGFSKITLNGVVKFLHGDLPALIKNIKEYYPGAILPIH